MSAVATTPLAEEREAHRRRRDGERLARASAEARDRQAAQAKRRRDKESRDAIARLRRELKDANRDYSRAFAEALRADRRRGHTRESIAAAWDHADRCQARVLRTSEWLRRLSREVQGVERPR